MKVFYLPNGIDCSMETRISGVVSMSRQEKNKRLYNLNLECRVDDSEETFKATYEIP